MAPEIDLIFAVTICLVAALVLGLAAQWARLSPVAGYLVAGMVVGPLTDGADPRLASGLAEIGVILLMFGVGLQLHVRDLLAVRRVAVPGALGAISITTTLGALLGGVLGWGVHQGAVVGITLSVASTVVLVRVMGDRDTLHTPAGHLAIGWLIVEDLFSVLVLVTLPFLADARRGAPELWAQAGTTLAGVSILVVVAATVGRRTIPALFSRVARTRSRELFTLTVLVTALGIAIVSARLFGASLALGAFLAGLIVGQSDFGLRAASEALPMRDAFAVLFFVSVGMRFDPEQIAEHPGTVGAILLVVLVAKPIVAFGVLRLLRRPSRTAARVAIALAQIGELSFVIGALADELDLIPPEARHAVIAASIVSITASPVLVGLVERLPIATRVHEQLAPLRGDAHHAVVVGYGPVGRTLTRLLRENGIEPTIVELNADTVAALRQQGIRAVYGDASHGAVLEAAGIRGAISLIFAASGTPPAAIIRAARELRPEVRILARSTYLRDARAARDAGADVVVAAEGEVALAMAERLLTDLGATREQLDRARDRVRRDLGAIE